MKFYDDFGLINSRPDEKNSENALLFTVEHFFLTKSAQDYENIKESIEASRIGDGLFLQHPANTLQGEDRYMSHDQLTAIVAFSYHNDLDFHKEIWKEIKRQWFRYNNVEVPQTMWEMLTNRRFLHPRDIIFYGYCADSIIFYLTLPLLWIIMIISSFKMKKVRPHGTFIATDGKLLNFVRCKASKKNILWKLVWKLNDYIVRKRIGTLHEVFKIYFPYEDHPNVIASKGCND